MTTGTDDCDPAYAAAPQDLSDMSYANGDVATPDTAIGYTYWGGFHWNNWYIPGGQLYGQVTGSGFYVSDAGGDFITYNNMCDWNIDQAWYNTSGTKYMTWSTPTHNTCVDFGIDKYGYGGSVLIRAGKSCTILYSEWRQVRVDAVCHTIHS